MFLYSFEYKTCTRAVQWSVECSRGDVLVLVLDRCRSLPLYMLIDPKESQSVEFVVKEEWSKYRTNNWRNSQHTHTFRREPFLICICFYYYFRRVFWRNRRMMAVGEILQQKGSEKENCLLWCCFYEYIFAVASFFICIFIFLLLFLFHFLFRSIFAEIHMFCGGGNGIKKFFILFSFPLGSLFFSLICHHIGIVILEYVFLLLYQKFADISLEYCFLLWPQKPTKKNYGECQRSHGMEYYICKTLKAKKLVVVCYKLIQLEITVGYSDWKAHFFL